MSMTYNSSIPSGSSEMVTLPNYVANAGAGTLNVMVSNPDGNPDENGLNDNMSSDFWYMMVTGLPFTEDFESNSFTTNNWNLTNNDNDITQRLYP